jgi:hypothetical protein
MCFLFLSLKKSWPYFPGHLSMAALLFLFSKCLLLLIVTVLIPLFSCLPFSSLIKSRAYDPAARSHPRRALRRNNVLSSWSACPFHPLHLGWNICAPLVTQAMVCLKQTPVIFCVVIYTSCQFLIAMSHHRIIVACHSY